ncbi:hypothetical protein P301_I10096 [Saccharomyces cerevisiae P301]|uniref:EC1118_1I12_0133p n=1 Tax=Saccharomyces cerevisiae (strain Lalvin EC1118 / Prise de mousse) TaxID=643680 RepID=C8ZAV6_YEAS8|nr:hypothetical protein P301_I10096 [Saccharomyces cerevisiae P301]EWG95392.1 hypothetical protein R103_I10121 [Saccharomyces cerevisiae R103]CAY80350.1 EC1118_1I12_0133p [Saccharomyces cerevisiae EC1118]
MATENNKNPAIRFLLSVVGSGNSLSILNGLFLSFKTILASSSATLLLNLALVENECSKEPRTSTALATEGVTFGNPLVTSLNIMYSLFYLLLLCRGLVRRERSNCFKTGIKMTRRRFLSLHNDQNKNKQNAKR